MGCTPSAPATKVVALLCLLTTLGILFSTLWPFNPFPPNHVSWLVETNGIRVGRRGVVLSEGALRTSSSASGDEPCTLELWIKPAHTDSVSTVLNFYEPGNPWRFLLRQYHTGLIVSHDVPVLADRPRRIKLDVDDGLRQNQLTFITITSGRNGTRVYFDAKPKRTFPHFQISSDDLSGQLVLGSSTVISDPWSGEVHGLAIYPRELNSEEVLQSYQRWTEGAVAASDLDSITFTFAERGGNIVRDQGALHRDLAIPVTYRVPHHSFLTPPWREFEATVDYLWDVLRNIAGFLPFGFLVCAWFRRSKRTSHPVLFTTLLGCALSLGIEILQAYIPQRESGLSDVITNTLGTALGAVLVPSWIGRKLLPRG